MQILEKLKIQIEFDLNNGFSIQIFAPNKCLAIIFGGIVILNMKVEGKRKVVKFRDNVYCVYEFVSIYIDSHEGG